MSEEDTTEITTDESEVTTDRRSLFTKGAAVAAVAAVAGLSSSRTVQAANGDTMFVGTTHPGTTTTALSGGSSFRVVDGESTASASIYGSQGASAGSYGVRGAHSGSSGTGVFGEAAGSSGRGVYGKTTGSQGIAVYGQHLGNTNTGNGVSGISDNGAGLIGSGTTYDVLANGNGRLGLTKSGNSGSSTDTGGIGTVARDSSGNLWYCYATNKWQRLGGPAAAGSFHPITPVRVFDSRNAGFPTPGDFTASSDRVVSVKDGRDQTTGAVTTANAVPSGATAVAFNVTGTNTAGGNFLAVVPGDVASTDVSTLNWSGPGASIANASVSKLDGSRQVRIIAGPGGAFDAIVDITGYYL